MITPGKLYKRLVAAEHFQAWKGGGGGLIFHSAIRMPLLRFSKMPFAFFGTSKPLCPPCSAAYERKELSWSTFIIYNFIYYLSQPIRLKSLFSKKKKKKKTINFKIKIMEELTGQTIIHGLNFFI